MLGRDFPAKQIQYKNVGIEAANNMVQGLHKNISKIAQMLYAFYMHFMCILYAFFKCILYAIYMHLLCTFQKCMYFW